MGTKHAGRARRGRPALSAAAVSISLLAAGCGDPGAANRGTSVTREALSGAGPALMRTATSPAPSGASSFVPGANGLEYHGGPVLSTTLPVFLVWYGNWGTLDRSIVEDLVSSIGGSSYYRIDTTYGDANASPANLVRLGGEVNDAYSRARALTDADVSAIVAAHVASQELPLDSRALYVVMGSSDVTETSGSSTFCADFCAWHNHGTFSQTVGNTTSSADLKYAFVGDGFTRCPAACAPAAAPTPNGSAAGDAVANTLVHEIEAAVTDPDLNAWITSPGTAQAVENADRCAWSFGSTYRTGNGGLANVHLGGRDFLLQQNWVNSRGGLCALSWQEPPLYGNQGPGGVAVNMNANGSLDAVYIGGNGVPYHTAQGAAGADFGGESLLGATTNRAKEITTARNADGRLEAFYIGSNNVLYHNWQASANGPWHGEDPLAAGTTAFDLAVASNSDGRLEVFYIGSSDRALYHVWQTAAGGTWSSPALLGAASDTAMQLSAAANQDGRLEVFFVGRDNVPHHLWQGVPGNSWSSSALLGASNDFVSQVVVGQNQDGRLEAFLVGVDSVIRHAVQVPQPSWTIAPLGTFSEQAALLTVAQNQDGRLEIFYTQPDSSVLYHKAQTAPNSGSWTAQAPLIGSSDSAWQLTATRNQDGRLEVFYVTIGLVLSHTWQTSPGGSWSGAFWLGNRAQDRQLCFQGNNCASNVCSRFYPDNDADAFPNPAGIAICGTTAPAKYIPGRADGRTDCFDQSAAVNPGVTGYSSASVTNWGWDLNCSGVVESNPQAVVGCSTTGGTCTRVFGNYSASACGTNQSVLVCGDPTGHGGCGTFSTGQTQSVTCH